MKKTKKQQVKALDAHWRREIVEARDWNTCQKCGRIQDGWDSKHERKTRIQWAHVHTREYYITRWEPDNALALCADCHMWFDNHKVLSFEWFRNQWPERWDRIQKILQSGTKTGDLWVREKFEEIEELL